MGGGKKIKSINIVLLYITYKCMILSSYNLNAKNAKRHVSPRFRCVNV